MKVGIGFQVDLKNQKQSISDALELYFNKYGAPPRILEVSDQLEKVELPEGCKVVVETIRVPKNIIFIGVE